MTDRPEDTLQRVLDHLVKRQDDNEKRINMLERLSQSAQETQASVAESLKGIKETHETIASTHRQIGDILVSHEHRLNKLDPAGGGQIGPGHLFGIEREDH